MLEDSNKINDNEEDILLDDNNEQISFDREDKQPQKDKAFSHFISIPFFVTFF